MSPRKVAVNVKKLPLTSFFALCASLCGLLSGLVGCAFSKAIKGIKETEVKKEPVRVVAGKRINLPDEITVRQQTDLIADYRVPGRQTTRGVVAAVEAG